VTALDAPLEIETGPNPRAAVIWLHGLGADGNDFVPIVPALGLPPALPLRFVFPHAPYRPVTLNGGYVMRAWYDLAVVDGAFRQDAAHIAQSVEAVQALMRRETERGIDPGAIVLAGFSQGAVVALHAGLRSDTRLGGLLILSAPVPDAAELLAGAAPASADTPIFLAHGMHDPMVSYALGERLYRSLHASGRNVEWHAYPIEHTVSLEEVTAVGRWLTNVLVKA